MKAPDADGRTPVPDSGCRTPDRFGAFTPEDSYELTNQYHELGFQSNWTPLTRIDGRRGWIWTVNVEWKREWEKRAVHFFGYQGIDAVGIDMARFKRRSA
jgi:hypothetical protein